MGQAGEGEKAASEKGVGHEHKKRADSAQVSFGKQQGEEIPSSRPASLFDPTAASLLPARHSQCNNQCDHQCDI
jgi:hypothetical protein